MCAMDKRILIIIPAYNEAGNIEKLVDSIIRDYSCYDYIVINDGSSDGTDSVCIRNSYNVINLPINLGIGGAVQTGYRYALENGYDIAVQVDGDGQHDLKYIEKLVEPIIEERADAVIGSRFLENKGFQSTAARRVGIRFLSGLIRMLCGSKIYDVTSGYRAVNKRFIKVFAEDYSYDYPEPEAIISVKMHRGVITELPVVMKERESGESSINLRNSVYYMIKVTLELIICRISFGIRR